MRAPRAGRWGQKRKELGGRERLWEGGRGQASHSTSPQTHSWDVCVQGRDSPPTLALQ